MGKQKRSENTYQKINTIFKRDVNNIIMPFDGYVDPALNWLENCKFRAEEKVDGTNVRIEVTKECVNEFFEDIAISICSGVKFHVAYKGKTDNAELPKMLRAFMEEIYPADVVLPALGLKEFIPESEFSEHKWDSYNDIPKMYTIYGEGYGVKIQSVGGNYLKDSNKVIGVDVKVTMDDNSSLYLLENARDDIMNKMNMPIVPLIGYFTIPEAIEYVKRGFKSFVAENPSPEFLAEGLVCKSPVGVCDRRGNRIVFKVKTCDWNKYFAKYGTYDKVEQEENNHH